MGTGNSGLFMLTRQKVRSLTPPDNWQQRAVLSVLAAEDGGLWVGTEGAGLYRLRDGVWSNLAKDAGIRNPYIWSLVETKDQGILAGTWGGSVFQSTGGQFNRAPGIETFTTPMTAMLPAREGGVWVGSRAGVFRYANGRAEWLEGEGGHKMRDVRAIFETSEGDLWIGSHGDGLALFRGGKLTQYLKTDGLPNDYVQCIQRDSARTLWIGTMGGGLARLKDGHFSVIGAQQGLVNSVICHIEEDGLGFLWIGTHDGIYRIALDDLNRCADGVLATVNSVAYGANEGMPSAKCSGGLQPSGCKLADGTLVFATDRGLALVDPRTVETNALPPPVLIEALRVDGRRLDLRANPGAPVEIGPGPTRIEFDYTGLSFSDPEGVRFRRRLVGLEKEWTVADRQRTADYGLLPPGSYVFQVKACNNHSVWNESGASLAVTVLPFFWQTLWFRVVAVSSVLTATGFVVWFETRRRMRRKVESLERQRALERERTRIARDMHDELGSWLTRITMLSETAKTGKASGREMERIYETARSATRAMDEIVWAVNPKHDTMEGLVDYLEKYSLDFLESSGMRCRLEIPMEFPSWSPRSDQRHNLFLAFKEALTNSVKHSGADMVFITVELGEDQYRLSVKDTGRGFNTAEATTREGRFSPGNGLGGMRARLASIGGTCEIHSVPGEGTTVTFIIPDEPKGRRDL